MHKLWLERGRKLLLALLLLSPVTSTKALYDPPPLPQLAFLEGRWSGQLTYRDYQEPHNLVTLKTDLFVALLAPNRIALHLIYDDGPKKTVHSYESLTLVFDKNEVRWSDGKADYPYQILKTDQKPDGSLTLLLESRGNEAGKPILTQETLELGADHFSFEKQTGSTESQLNFSSRHSFERH